MASHPYRHSNPSRGPHRDSPPGFDPIGQLVQRSQSRSRSTKQEQYQNPRYESSTMVDDKRLTSASTQAVTRNNDQSRHLTSQERASTIPKSKLESDKHSHAATTVTSYSQVAKSANVTTSTGSADSANRQRTMSNQQNPQAKGPVTQHQYSPREFQGNRNGSSGNSFHHQRDMHSQHSPRAGYSPVGESGGPPRLPVTSPKPTHRQTDTSSQHNSRVNSPTSRRTNGSVDDLAHQRDTYARRDEKSIVGEFDAGLGPQPKDADHAIEDALHRLDDLTAREIRACEEKIRERTELQHSLRDCFNIQQKEYENTFKEQHFKLLNIMRERDELLRQNKTLQTDFLDMQRQLHQATSYDRPDPVAVASASAFTPHTADGVSGQDLIRDTERLNDEIYQFAALLAEEFEKTPRERGPNVNLIATRDFNVLRKIFRENTADLVVRAKAQREHSMLVHAVQTCMISCCSGVLMTLLPCHKRSDTFEDMHRRIRKAESQGVSGQWRSLTYRHGLNEMEQDIFNSFKTNIWKLCEVFRVSTAMESTYRDSLKSIASKTFHLHRMIYAEILSGDIKIISPDCGTAFDPETMEASEERSGDAKSLHGRRVMCTTDMGLMKLVVDKVFSDEEYKFTEHKTTILKAKVFLSSPTADDGNFAHRTS